MVSSLLLSLPDDLVVDQVRVLYECVTICIRSVTPSAVCPLCSQPATRIHSRYRRTLADVPSGGRQLVLSLVVRKFFCQTSHCPRRIFAERFPDLARPWARMTLRFCAQLEEIGFATTGEKGARLATRLGLPTSPATMLRRLKAVPAPASKKATKVGIDDFAFRRGLKYGTLLVNLETHQVIDLLPDRTVATATTWFKKHPDIQIVSRDRGSDYAAAATAGAPQALQVCDRWHLLRNLSEYVTTFLARMRAQIRKASQALTPPRQKDPLADRCKVEREALDQTHQIGREERCSRKTVLELTKAARAAQRLDQYQHVLELWEQGYSAYEIAPRVGISERTVRQWRTHGIETRPRRRRPSPLDRYASYLRQRWEQGCQNGQRLYEELQEMGYPGSSRALYHYLNRWRSPRAIKPPSLQSKRRWRSRKQAAPPAGPFDECSAKQAVWLYLRSPDTLSPTEQEQLTFLRQVHPTLEITYQLVQAFAVMLRTHKGEHLETWLEQVRASHIPELLRFAKGIERDKAAVQAALLLPHSNGVVEGHVNRLKLIKRMMYGRAAFPLLRQRVLSVA
jgi:transposase